MDGGKPVRFLNELEFIKGEVWANVWQTECIARINHKTGVVRCKPPSLYEKQS